MSSREKCMNGFRADQVSNLLLTFCSQKQSLLLNSLVYWPLSIARAALGLGEVFKKLSGGTSSRFFLFVFSRGSRIFFIMYASLLRKIWLLIQEWVNLLSSAWKISLVHLMALVLISGSHVTFYWVSKLLSISRDAVPSDSEFIRSSNLWSV